MAERGKENIERSAGAQSPVRSAEKKGEVTQLLVAWSQGDENALASLMPLVYDELLRMARKRFRREREGHTLPSAAIIHEAYLRLVNQDIKWQNRAHFFAVASQAMRRVLVDYARRKKTSKRGGAEVRVSLVEAAALAKPEEIDVVALNDALERLASIDPRQFRIVELRYFGGLTVEETAEVLGVSAGTVKNDWSLAKAWLFRQLSKK
jgi:RNA polymerase sigma factor (TIGR02999 family)